MEYAQLEEIWGAPTTQPSKSKGRRQSGGAEQDEFSKKRNVDMRVPPAPQAAPDYGLYPGPEYQPYRMSAPINPFYSHNRFHGDHLGTPYPTCPHCHGHGARIRRRRRHGSPADTEFQRMTLYLTVATLALLLYDIGTRK